MTAMPTFDPAWVQRTTAGRWLGDPPAAPTQPATGFSIDTRTLAPGQAFVAIKGPNHDGHDHIDAALSAGAPFALVADSSAISNPQSAILLVPDPIAALQQLAHAHRDRLAEGTCIVISVSGSNGKTTTRHLIHHVLTHAGKRGTQSPKSFNNHLGVPLTLLAADPGDDFVACEVGTNHPGEIDALGAIVRPNVAVITSIGEEHMEFFGTLEHVEREELTVLRHLGVGGPCFAGPGVPLRDARVEPAFLRGEHLMGNARALRRRMRQSFAPIREAGALAAWCGLWFDVAYDTIADSMQTVETPPGRWQLIELGDAVTLVHDAYNANPTSTEAAVMALGDMEASRRVLVLGDMNELGGQGVVAHRRAGELAAVCADVLVCIGSLAGHAAAAARGVKPVEHWPTWTDDLPARVTALLEPGDVVLLKASRGMRLERLIPAIEARFGPCMGHRSDEPRV